VMVDDKPLLLAEMKRAMGDNLTTVFVRQGHYATESATATIDPDAEMNLATEPPREPSPTRSSCSTQAASSPWPIR